MASRAPVAGTSRIRWPRWAHPTDPPTPNPRRPGGRASDRGWSSSARAPYEKPRSGSSRERPAGFPTSCATRIDVTRLRCPCPAHLAARVAPGKCVPRSESEHPLVIESVANATPRPMSSVRFRRWELKSVSSSSNGLFERDRCSLLRRGRVMLQNPSHALLAAVGIGMVGHDPCDQLSDGLEQLPVAFSDPGRRRGIQRLEGAPAQ